MTMTSRALPVVLVALCGTVAAGCTSATSFIVTLTGQTTVEGNPALMGTALTRFPAIGSFSNIDLEEHSVLKQQGVTRAGVQSLKLEHLELKILSPADQGFDFLDDLQFFVSAGGQEALVAEKKGIAQLSLPPPNPVLEFDVFPVELRPYLSAPTLEIVGRGGGRVPAQTIGLGARVQLRVEPKIF